MPLRQTLRLILRLTLRLRLRLRLPRPDASFPSIRRLELTSGPLLAHRLTTTPPHLASALPEHAHLDSALARLAARPSLPTVLRFTMSVMYEDDDGVGITDQP